MKPGIAIPEVSVEGADSAVWQPSGEQCGLCGGRRRDYLFVVGKARVTRCHECSLISKAGGGDGDSLSYVLDGEADRTLRQALAEGGRQRILQVVLGDRGGLSSDPRLEPTTISLPQEAGVLDALPQGAFDAAFVNGALEQVRDPAELLRAIARAVRPGGVIEVVVRAATPASLPSVEERLPRNVFPPATLVRVAHSAGLQVEECGLLPCELDELPDPGGRPVAFRRVHALLRMLGMATGAEGSLLRLRARATAERRPRRLSVIMPVFNEAATFLETFERVFAWRLEGVEREIIVVESNSTDGSRELVRGVESRPGVSVIYQDAPRGKGSAVRAGLAAASGDMILIQDADLEYDVADYEIVLEPLLRLSAMFVLGSRHMGGRTWKIRQFADYKWLAALMNLAHQFFTWLVNRLYGAQMRDPTTMYKVFRQECFRGIDFRRERFDFDFELVCKLIRRGHVPVEVPINYRARSYSEGKKVRIFRDPFTWLRTILASRFEPLGR